ncbi:MAG: hypothetical protein V4805_08270 [Pseudomonadota bacterium]
MIDTLSKQDFTALAPGSITLDHQAQQFTFSVVESRDLPPISPRLTPFAIVLQGPAKPVLQQGIYALIHPQHGQLDLFIVPISSNAEHTKYEIIFN